MDDPAIWVKLVRVGVLYRNTRMGAAFEGIREGRDLAGEMEFFHICRKAPCRIAGGRNADYLSSEKNQIAVTLGASFSVSGKMSDVNPITDRPGPVQVAQSYVVPMKALFGIILFGGESSGDGQTECVGIQSE